MSELELLEAISNGQMAFCRDQFPNLDEIDRSLRGFTVLGYIEKVVRAVYPFHSDRRRLMRADVVGGLTLLGESRLHQLADQAKSDVFQS